jgi:hypothetical protein
MDGFAECREPQHFSLVAIGAKSEAGCRIIVEQPEAVGLVLGSAQLQRIRLAAEQVGQPPGPEAARAVVGAIAAAVGCIDQRVVIAGMEQSGERVRQMMVVEGDARRPQSLVGEVARRIEGQSGIADPLARHRADQFALRAARNRKRPSRARGEIPRGIVDPRQRDRLDVVESEAGLREAFGDRLAGKATAVALDPGDPLLRHGGDQPVIVIERRACVMRVVDAQNDHAPIRSASASPRRRIRV